MTQVQLEIPESNLSSSAAPRNSDEGVLSPSSSAAPRDEAKAESSHAPLAPSSLYRSMECLASLVPLEYPVPQIESPQAAEGTKAHALLNHCLTHQLLPSDLDPLYLAEFNSEIIHHITNLLEIIAVIKRKIGPDNIFAEHTELPVKFSDYIFGTLDYVLLYIKDGEKRAYILDFKYGEGIAVLAKDNPQLMTYLVAMIKTLEWDVTTATISIYQPRNQDEVEEDLDQVRVTKKEAKAWAAKLRKFEKKAIKVLKNETKPKELPGDHCGFCPRLAVCRGYATNLTSTRLLALDSAPPLYAMPGRTKVEKIAAAAEIEKKVSELSDDQLKNILKYSDNMVAFVKAVKAYVMSRVAKGTFSDYKLVAGRSIRKLDTLTHTPAYIASELKLLGLKEPYNKTFKGLGEIEKEIGKNKIDHLTYKTTPKPALVPESDPRPALTGALDLITNLDEEEESN